MILNLLIAATVQVAPPSSVPKSAGPAHAEPAAVSATLPQPEAAATQASVTLPQDTPVELMAITEVSTASAQPGLVFKMRVNKPVLIDDRVVVPVGTWAFGRVESAVDAGGFGKSGRMTARLMHIQLGAVEIPLDGQVSAKGQGAGSAAAAVLFTGLVGLFHRGNNAKIKAGEIVSGFVARDVVLPARDVGSAEPKQ